MSRLRGAVDQPMSLVSRIAREANEDEVRAFHRVFRRIMPNIPDATYPIAYFGANVAAYTQFAATGQTLTRDHWLSWRCRGQQCLLAQLTPPVPRTKPAPTEGEATEVVAPPIYLLLPSNRLYILRDSPAQSFRRYNSTTRMFSFPTVALEGTLVERVRSPSHDSTVCERLRADTMLTLAGANDDDLLTSYQLPIDVCFLAHDCLWSRVQRTTIDAQSRMMQTRLIIEGDPTNAPMLTSREHNVQDREPGRYLHAIEYKPSMPLMHWRAIVSDVPEVLRGCVLAGVEFRVASALHTQAPAIGDGFYTTASEATTLIQEINGDDGVTETPDAS